MQGSEGGTWLVLWDGEVVSGGSEARQIIAKVGLWWPAADEGGSRLAAEAATATVGGAAAGGVLGGAGITARSLRSLGLASDSPGQLRRR